MNDTVLFFQLCSWEWPAYKSLIGGYDKVYSTRAAAEGALLALADRGDQKWFIAELRVNYADLSKEFREHFASTGQVQ